MSTTAVANKSSPPLLHPSLDQIDDGFLLLDATDTVVAFNKPVLSFFPHLEGTLQPGTQFTEIVDRDVEVKRASRYPREAETWRQRRMAVHGKDYGRLDEYQPDGRWIRITDHATADGGRIVHYRDVTEDRRHVDEAAHYTSL